MRPAIALASIVGLALPRVALAQPSAAETAAARALFDEGRTLASQEQWDEAADRFRRAHELRSSPAIHHNLAVVLERMGRLVESTEELRAALREAEQGDPTRASAEALLELVEPRIGRIRITVEGDGPDVEVVFDGRVLPRALVGVTVPADPGRHTVAARRAGVESAQEVVVEEGGAVEVGLSAPPATSTPPPAGRPLQGGLDVPPDAPSDDTSDGDGPGWPLVVLGGVAIGGGVALDVLPDSASNHRLDALDFAPLGLYAAGAVLVVLGVL